jgi:hypothetical protein
MNRLRTTPVRNSLVQPMSTRCSSTVIESAGGTITIDDYADKLAKGES